MSVKLIVGLQNPGNEYVTTRHNAGAWFLEYLGRQHNAIFKNQSALKSSVAKVDNIASTCYLALPSTFMNHSGQAVCALAQFYRINPEEILVVHDDLDLAPGRIQLKTGGGHGGHNGLRDIAKQLATPLFHRLRIGIGHPRQQHLVVNYVLSKPSDTDLQLIMTSIERAIAVVPQIICGNLAQVMTDINREK